MLGTLLFAFILLPQDSTTTLSHTIDEVVVVGTGNKGAKRSEKGQTASIDEHLAELNHISLIRRGSYAWEPMINNMASERLSVTIDGMKIFYACTDKMDPVTSYVESGNLQSISLNSGLDGNPQSTGNIGGSLDLKLRKVGFDHQPLSVNVSAGHEWNGHLQVYGSDMALSSHRFYTNFGVFYRHADDYLAGHQQKVDYSQFQKFNTFANIGIRIGEKDVMEGSVIYDRATNVGYPALNMDVSKAEGLITSLAYKHLFVHPLFTSWETKVYYNHIIHTMDDTKRPDVEIHMDMPGDSWTTGLYSILRASNATHDASINYDLYYNRRFADMTMYPGGAKPMYMVTWPDVGTLNTGMAMTDNITLSSQQSVHLSAKMAWQTQRLNNKEGYDALEIFFPGMKQVYYQIIGRVAVSYTWRPTDWQLSLGTGWGSRAPSVTEAYGYYLNNTYDRYDYMGNPRLKNESAIEVNGAVKWTGIKNLTLGVDANSFFFSNYIIGVFENRLSAMTVGAKGVKVFSNQKTAKIINASLQADWQILRWMKWNTKLSYAMGKDAEGDDLPFISPLAYATSIDFSLHKLQMGIILKGNAKQSKFAEKYGETVTPAYSIVNIHAQYAFAAFHAMLQLRTGIENLLDKTYSTYTDWNKIPQKGRNVYANINIQF